MTQRSVTPKFWRGKRVFITGHTGFKGSWLALWLQQLGAEVAGYALEPPSQPNLFSLARVAEKMQTTHGDVGDLTLLQKTLATFKPDIVFHLAAQSVVRRSYEEPVRTFATNVLGSVHLMEAVRHAQGVRAVVMVTSDKCYQNQEWVWGYRERDALGGHDPYSSSKGCAELAAASYRHAFFSEAEHAVHGVALATARAGNVIGGGDWKRDALVPDTVRALLAGDTLTLRNPQSTRPWQFVLDPLRGYLMLAERLYDGDLSCAEAWNFGPGGEVRTAGWVAARLHALWGRAYASQSATEAQPHEDTLLQLDVSKAAAKLGWETCLDVEGSLERIVSWTRAFEAGDNVQRVCEAQIAEHMTMAEEAVRA